MTPSVTINSLDEARSYFIGHSYLGPLIKACDSAPTGFARTQAMRELAKSLKYMVNADVKGLEAQAEAAMT